MTKAAFVFLFVALAACILVLVIVLFNLRKYKSKVLLDVSKFKNGAVISFDEETNRFCKRCKVGRIVKRKRFKLLQGQKGPTVREVTGSFRCTSCAYRGLSLREIKTKEG